MRTTTLNNMPAMVMERRIIVLLMLVSSSAKDERVGTCGAVGLPLQAEVQPFSVAHSQQRIMIWYERMKIWMQSCDMSSMMYLLNSQNVASRFLL